MAVLCEGQRTNKSWAHSNINENSLYFNINWNQNSFCHAIGFDFRDTQNCWLDLELWERIWKVENLIQQINRSSIIFKSEELCIAWICLSRFVNLSVFYGGIKTKNRNWKWLEVLGVNNNHFAVKLFSPFSMRLRVLRKHWSIFRLVQSCQNLKVIS